KRFDRVRYRATRRAEQYSIDGMGQICREGLFYSLFSLPLQQQTVLSERSDFGASSPVWR
ncbi:MAG: hypothetical protein ACTHZ1_08600, partial [Sphingobacterium sp.]